MTKAELARRVGTTRQQIGRLEEGHRKITTEWAERVGKALNVSPHEILYPHLVKSGMEQVERATNVFAITQGKASAEPMLSIAAPLVGLVRPGVEGHQLVTVIVEDDEMKASFSKGDAVIVDIDDKRVARPGIFALRIAGETRFRRIVPLAGSTSLSVRADSQDVPAETLTSDRLDLIGRVVLRLSTV